MTSGARCSVAGAVLTCRGRWGEIVRSFVAADAMVRMCARGCGRSEGLQSWERGDGVLGTGRLRREDEGAAAVVLVLVLVDAT